MYHNINNTENAFVQKRARKVDKSQSFPLNRRSCWHAVGVEGSKHVNIFVGISHPFIISTRSLRRDGATLQQAPATAPALHALVS